MSGIAYKGLRAVAKVTRSAQVVAHKAAFILADAAGDLGVRAKEAANTHMVKVHRRALLNLMAARARYFDAVESASMQLGAVEEHYDEVIEENAESRRRVNQEII